MALLHTQRRDDQGPSIPVLPTLGFGRHSPVHGVRACDQVRMFDDLPVINWPGAAHSNPGLFSIQFAFGGFLPRLERTPGRQALVDAAEAALGTAEGKAT